MRSPITAKFSRSDVGSGCWNMSPRYGISPYFAVIKPTIEMGFDYKKLNWLRRQFHPEVRGIG
jgi:hypothetical protein